MCLGAKLDPQITDKEIKFTTFAFASYSIWKESFASILYTLIAKKKQCYILFHVLTISSMLQFSI